MDPFPSHEDSGRVDASFFSLPKPLDQCLALSLWIVFAWLSMASLRAGAAFQFDAFAGFDGHVAEGRWTPITVELFNDGPGFSGTIDVVSGLGAYDQRRSVPLDLPSQTRKRVVIPWFVSTRSTTLEVRLLDEKGRVRAERPSLRYQILGKGLVLVAVPRLQSGLPVMPESAGAPIDRLPTVVRTQVELVPDHPMAWDGIDAFYLNSERALELKAAQVAALLSWVHQGGHLVLGLEQGADVSGAGWLRGLIPGEPNGSGARRVAGVFQAWIQEAEVPPAAASPVLSGTRRGPANRNGPRGPAQGPAVVKPGTPPQGVFIPGNSPQPMIQRPILSPDPAFESGELSMVNLGAVQGEVRLRHPDGNPLVVQAARGRGRVTLLAFSPDREPFRNWVHRGWFWAKILEVPQAVFYTPDPNPYYSMPADGILGAMLDSHQVRKLPLEWLLALLILYLAVIGPLDYFVLKRIGRQMLTWVTFPVYVVVFSLLIYWIAARLRAGDLEWNRVHLVDVVQRGAWADLRGRSYHSIYSPATSGYRFSLPGGNGAYGAFRSEYLGAMSGGQDTGGFQAAEHGNGFEAEVRVPVWTSQLGVSEWGRLTNAPIRVQLTPATSSQSASITVENRTGHRLTSCQLVMGESLHSLGTMQPGQTLTATVEGGTAGNLTSFVVAASSGFQNAVQSRRQAFGREQGHLPIHPDPLTAVSFGRAGVGSPNGTPFFAGNFSYPRGLELSDWLGRGGAVLLAWDEGADPGGLRPAFKEARGTSSTLWRVIVPVAGTRSDPGRVPTPPSHASP